MKAADIRAMTEAQLQETLTDLHVEWRTLRFQEAVGRLTATSRVGQIRRDIARIKTIQTERVMDAAAREQIAQRAAGRAADPSRSQSA